MKHILIGFCVVTYGFFIGPIMIMSLHLFYYLIKLKTTWIVYRHPPRWLVLCSHIVLNYATNILFMGVCMTVYMCMPYVIVDDALFPNLRPFHMYNQLHGGIAFSVCYIAFMLLRNEKIRGLKLPRKLRRFGDWTKKYI